MSSIQHLFLLRLFFQRKNLNLLEDEIREKKNEKPKKTKQNNNKEKTTTIKTRIYDQT